MASSVKRDRMTESIIERMKSVMSERGVSARRLSELSGVSLQATYKILRKENSPTLDTIRQLMAPLDMTLQAVDATHSESE